MAIVVLNLPSGARREIGGEQKALEKAGKAGQRSEAKLAKGSAPVKVSGDKE